MRSGVGHGGDGGELLISSGVDETVQDGEKAVVPTSTSRTEIPPPILNVGNGSSKEK